MGYIGARIKRLEDALGCCTANDKIQDCWSFFSFWGFVWSPTWNQAAAVDWDEFGAHAANIVDFVFVASCVEPQAFFFISPVDDAHFSIVAPVEDGILGDGRDGIAVFFDAEVLAVGVIAEVDEADNVLIGYS